MDRPCRALLLLAACAAPRLAGAGVMGVRFSLHPTVASAASLQQAVKQSTRDLRSLGLAVSADSVSSCLLGPEPALFEAMRVVLGRASRLDGSPRVSLVCQFSAGDPMAGSSFEPPPRTAGATLDADADGELPRGSRAQAPPSKRTLMRGVASALRRLPLQAAGALEQASGGARAKRIADGLAQASSPESIAARIGKALEAGPPVAAGEAAAEDDWVAEAYALPTRVACQFAVYPVDGNHAAARTAVAERVAASPAARGGDVLFCETLEGDGAEVMEVLRDALAVARESSSHAVLHATLTTNLQKRRRYR